MKLTIIIVNWNTLDLTRQTLLSVYAQAELSDFEVVVIDNHSSDGSVSMITTAFPQVRLIENTENYGFGRANNQGLERATGAYVMFLNSDTIVRDHAIDRLMRYLDTHPGVAMVGPKLLNGDGTFQHACRRTLPTPQSAFFHLFGLTHLAPHSRIVNAYKHADIDPGIEGDTEAMSGAAMLLRRTVYEKVGGFDAETFFMYGEDLDFCKRVGDAGFVIRYVPQAVITHFGGGSTKKRRTKSLIDFYDAMWRYYEKHYAERASFFMRGIVRSGIFLRMLVALAQNIAKNSKT